MPGGRAVEVVVVVVAVVVVVVGQGPGVSTFAAFGSIPGGGGGGRDRGPQGWGGLGDGGDSRRPALLSPGFKSPEHAQVLLPARTLFALTMARRR